MVGRTVCLKSVSVWLNASPVSFALIAWMGRDASQDWGKANRCIPPSNIYLHCLFLLVCLSHNPLHLCFQVLYIVWLKIIFFISHTLLLPSVPMPSIIQYVKNYFPIILYTGIATDSVIDRMNVFIVFIIICIWRVLESWRFLMSNLMSFIAILLFVVRGILVLRQENIKSKVPPVV